jgi:hypothetical protein
MFFRCDYCNYDCKTKQIFYKHIITEQHKNQVLKATTICDIDIIHNSHTSHIGLEFNISNTSDTKIKISEPLPQLEFNTIRTQNNHDNINTSTPVVNMSEKKKFILSAFGEENMSFLTNELEYDIICNSTNPFELLVNKVYSQKANFNIYISDKRNLLVKYLLPDNMVQVGQLSDVLEILVTKYKNIINSCIDKFINNVDTVQKNYLIQLKRYHISGAYDNTYKKFLKGKMFVFGERSKRFLVNEYFLAGNRPSNYLSIITKD